MTRLSLMDMAQRRMLGVDIVWAPNATERVWLFPESKNRSKRVHKKLLARHGGRQWIDKPAMYRVGDTFYAHPAYREQFLAQARAIEDAQLAGLCPPPRAEEPLTISALAERLRELKKDLPRLPPVSRPPLWPLNFVRLDAA